MSNYHQIGPFAFHLSERTVMRLMPLLPADRPATFEDVRAALVQIVEQDNAKTQTIAG